MARYDDLNVSRIAIIAVVSVVVTAVTALAVQVVFHALVGWQEAEKRAASSYHRQQRVFDQQRGEITGYGVDPRTGNVTIPIDEAIELVVVENKEEQSNAIDTDTET